MIENFKRLDPDEVTRWESFARLVKEGREIADISATFGIPEQGVKRILALGNLMPRVRTLSRAEALNVAPVRHLTLARKRQHKAWLVSSDYPLGSAPWR